jgi:glycine oxidase
LIALALSRIVDAEKNWGNTAVWEVMSANKAGEWAPPSVTGQLIHDTLSAHIHPQKATQALGRAVENLGGVITTAGARQGAILDARGWQGLVEMSEDLGQEIGNGVKGQAALLDFARPSEPQLFADGLHIVPHLDGTVAIGSTSERYFKSPTDTDGQLNDLIAKAKQLFPVLRDAPVLVRWAGVRPRAFTRAPMLGKHPVNPDWFIANGGFKIGFGMAPKIGQVMAALILDRVDLIPDDFRANASMRPKG